MKPNYWIALAVLVGATLGGAAVQGLHAQSKAVAYVVSEIEIADKNAYANEYLPLAVKALKASGQKQLAAGGKTVSLAGEAPKARVVVSVFESLEKAQAAYTSPEYLEARKVGDKYAKLRIFAVEGLPQQ
jgi:uncharacterized protein (DUF1330 family)